MKIKKSGGRTMKFSGRAITEKERNRLLGFAGVSNANECYIGVMKMKDQRYYSVARFFNNDKFLFYVTL